MMTVVCGWCHTSMGSKPSSEPGETTGLCADCLEKWFPDDEQHEDTQPKGQQINGNE